MAGQTGNDGKKNAEIRVPIKYLSNFWRTLEMSLINCEVNLILAWPENCVIIPTNVANQNAMFAITHTNLYVPVITLSQQDNAKFLQQLKSGFKRVINWNKYLSKPELLAQNPDLNHLVEPSFQGVSRPFVLAFENDTQRTKICTGSGDDYTTGSLLDYPYFKDSYKLIPVDLSKQQTLNADPRTIQQINFTADLDKADNRRIYFILEEVKETILNFAQGTVKVL